MGDYWSRRQYGFDWKYCVGHRKGGDVTEKKTSKATREKLEGKGAGKPAPPVKEIQIGKKPKVCIVGFAPGKENAPYDDPDFEIWGCNEMHMSEEVKRIDVLFELHDLEWIKEGKRWKEHYPWLRNNKKIPVIMQKAFDDIPMSVAYPWKEIEEKFGRYLTNTVAEQIALALLIGVKEIHLYGVNMATDTEFGSQKPSCEYFIGLARGMGVKVYVPPESDLLKSFYIYGKEDGQLSFMSTRLGAFMAEQDSKVGFFQNRISNDNAAMHQAIGAKNAAAYIDKSFVFPSNNFDKGSG